MNFGRYEVERELGRGGMAVVYLALDPRTGRRVAVKVLGHHLLADPDFRQRFDREARVIATLEGPSIVPLYDYGEEGDQPYLVFRYMEGGSLSDRLRYGPLPLQETAAVVGRIADALDHAHAQGIVHRDVKPPNVLFDGRGNAFLGDFGIARPADGALTLAPGAVIGTPAYMSPEQASGQPATGASDVYALGCVAYQALAGRAPFEADTPAALMLKHLHDEPPQLPATIPARARETIAAAMAKDPARRPRPATAIALALAQPSSPRAPIEVTRVAAGTSAWEPVPAPATRVTAPTQVAAPARDRPARPVTARRAPAGPATHRGWLVLLRAILATAAFAAIGIYIGFQVRDGALEAGNRLTTALQLGSLWLLMTPLSGIVAAIRRRHILRWASRALLFGPFVPWWLLVMPLPPSEDDDIPRPG